MIRGDYRVLEVPGKCAPIFPCFNTKDWRLLFNDRRERVLPSRKGIKGDGLDFDY